MPCAGPVLAAITVAGARGEINADIVALTLSFAVGTAIPPPALRTRGPPRRRTRRRLPYPRPQAADRRRGS
ncbi:hypothetical protein [Streptomyces lavendulae]|uniref:hypothetical protein n=1 Tax=Streptomyces lavendulae TaxID=1914 RepID=UPI0031EC726D